MRIANHINRVNFLLGGEPLRIDGGVGEEEDEDGADHEGQDHTDDVQPLPRSKPASQLAAVVVFDEFVRYHRQEDVS